MTMVLRGGKYPQRRPDTMDVGTDKFFSDTAEDLRRQKDQTVNEYLRHVLQPDVMPLVRIPTDFPYPSILLQDKECFQITIGSAGDFVGFFDPQSFLANANSTTTCYDYFFAARSNTALVPSYSLLTYEAHRAAVNANYAGRNTGLTNLQYASFFNSGRLTSARIRFKYIGPLQNHSGIIASGCQIFGKTANVTSALNALVDTNIQQLMVNKRQTPLEGTNCIWFPVDETCAEFATIDTSLFSKQEVSRLVYFFFGTGLPAGSVLDVDIIRNYEVTPNPTYVEMFVGSTFAGSSGLMGATKAQGSSSWWDDTMNFFKKNLGDLAITTVDAWKKGGPLASSLAELIGMLI